MASITENLTDQITELERKALSFVTDAQAPVTDYVGKVAEAFAARLPDDRPEPLTRGIDTLVTQVEFAKQVLDAQVDFAKAVLDAAVKPVRPATTKPKTVKAA